MTKALYGLLIAAGFASASALAQSGMPEPKTENGITYLCGGIGADEAEEMKQAASKYDLMLTFASTKGAYLADVRIDIADARLNPVLKTICDAPIMLIDFSSSGNYRISAEAGGRTLTRTAHIRTGGKATAMSMLWPMNETDTERTAMPGGYTGSTGASGDADGNSPGK